MSTTMPPSAGRRRLRTILRREREAANMTQDQVSIAMDWSLSKVIRIETGAVNISTNDLRALLDLYRVSASDLRNDLIELAKTARRPPWWTEFRDTLSTAMVYYIGLEPNAAEIQFFNNALVPGLLQTEDYARAAIHGSAPDELGEDRMEILLAVRMRRQVEVFGRPDPPQLTVVLDEAALRRQIGGPEILSKQLGHLLQLASRPHVTVQVIPFASGAHTGTFGPYIILNFLSPEFDKPVLFSEGAFDDDLVRERPEVIENYRRSFDRVAASALDAEASVEFIRRTIAELWQ